MIPIRTMFHTVRTSEFNPGFMLSSLQEHLALMVVGMIISISCYELEILHLFAIQHQPCYYIGLVSCLNHELVVDCDKLCFWKEEFYFHVGSLLKIISIAYFEIIVNVDLLLYSGETSTVAGNRVKGLNGVMCSDQLYVNQAEQQENWIHVENTKYLLRSCLW